MDIEPIGDLYKTQVCGLSRYMGVSLRIIEKHNWQDYGLGRQMKVNSECPEMADLILTMLVDEKKKISEVKGKSRLR